LRTDRLVLGRPEKVTTNRLRASRLHLISRTNPPSKRLVLENLVMHLCEEPKAVTSEWQQEELVL